ncbi:uncharacterized protein LOC128220739 [Mya arenaria]|uniref:uncharacterized protein LOC128220739 n=1 Tax=Mya arenaria TaxID=6604 RepID=UPI0022E7C370|nr:uncharacterized protein LOC128220739 [Mya arenaria]
MATCQKIENATNMCSVCLDHFRDPRKLPCDHDFCADCIEEYIKKFLTTEKDKSAFPCPLCRKPVVIKNLSIEGIEDFIEQLTKRKEVNTCVDMDKQTPTGIKCDPCNLDGTNTAADVFCGDCDEHLCNSCAKFHKRSKKLKKHVLITLAEKKSTSFFQESIDYKCKGHDKRLKYICLDHNSLGCSMCTITNHKNCKDVKSLREYINTSHCLDGRAQKLNQIHMLSQKCTQMQSHAVKSMQIECIASTLKDFQETVSVELNKARRKKDQSVNITHTVYSTMQADAKGLHGLLLSCDNDIDGKSVVVLADFNKKLENLTAQLESSAKETTVHLKKIEHSLTDTSKHLATTIDAMKAELRFPDLSVDFPSYFSTKYTCNPKPKEVDMMNEKEIVLLDESHQRLVVFDTKLFKTTSSWHFSHRPSNFAVVDSNTIAVSFQTERKIKVFKVKGSSLTEYNNLALEMPFVGLTFTKKFANSYLFCLDCDKRDVVRADFPRNKIESFSNIHLKREMITTIHTRIHADKTGGGSLFISLARANTVIGLTLDGKMKWTLNHPHLRMPMGLAIGPLGNLFVCCYEGQEIAKVDQTGKLLGLCKEDALRGTVRKVDFPSYFSTAPMALYYDASSDKFIVCDDEEGKEIKMFKTGDLVFHAI